MITKDFLSPPSINYSNFPLGKFLIRITKDRTIVNTLRFPLEFKVDWVKTSLQLIREEYLVIFVRQAISTYFRISLFKTLKSPAITNALDRGEERKQVKKNRIGYGTPPL
jgi:hypothetical protein